MISDRNTCPMAAGSLIQEMTGSCEWPRWRSHSSSAWTTFWWWAEFYHVFTKNLDRLKMERAGRCRENIPTATEWVRTRTWWRSPQSSFACAFNPYGRYLGSALILSWSTKARQRGKVKWRTDRTIISHIYWFDATSLLWVYPAWVPDPKVYLNQIALNLVDFIFLFKVVHCIKAAEIP